MPEALEEEILNEEVASARLVNNVDSHSTAVPRTAEESSARQSQLSDADIDTLRGRFPILAELSTGFIRGCPRRSYSP